MGLDFPLVQEQMFRMLSVLYVQYDFLLEGDRLKDAEKVEFMKNIGKWEYHLSLTNYEIQLMFEKMIEAWFQGAGKDYNDFVKALFLGNVDAMNSYMNEIALNNSFSSFDSGSRLPERTRPEYAFGIMASPSEERR